jgi:hypothetical protein
MEIILLIKLLLAHILTDFVFQPNSWVEKKQKKILATPVFWFHILIAAGLSYLFVADWTNWKIPLTIFLTHGIIDLTKLVLDKKAIKNICSTALFLVDQFLHILVIIIIWLASSSQIEVSITKLIITYQKDLLVLITAIIALTSPTGIFIGKIVEPFRKKINTNDSLKNAGTYIGVFERLMVLIFILANQFAAIGFLLASKSILRISKDSDKEERKKTEYVLVGTLLSFFTAIVIGLLTKYLMK